MVSKTEKYLNVLVRELRSKLEEDITNHNKLEKKKIKFPNFKKPSSWVGYKSNKNLSDLKKGELFYFIFNKTRQEICVRTTRELISSPAKFVDRGNFRGPTIDLLCAYIGKESWEKFVRENDKANIEDTSLARLYNTSSIETRSTIILLGFYFSIKDFSIKKIILSLTPKSEFPNVYQAREWGFHSFEDRIGLRVLEYDGEAKYEGQTLKIDLRRTNNGDQEFKIFCHLNQISNLRDQNRIFRASSLAFSENDDEGGYLNLEFLFIRISKTQLKYFDESLWSLKESKIISARKVNNIRFYLSINHKNFRVRSEPINSYKYLDNPDKPIVGLQKLAGTYKILNFGIMPGKVSISKFIIKNDGTALLKPLISPEERERTRLMNRSKTKRERIEQLNFLDEQPCILYPAGFDKIDKIVAITFISKMRPSNIAAFNGKKLVENGYNIGSFVSIGYKDTHDPYTEYFIIKKSEDFEPCSSDIKKLSASDFESLKLLKDKLESIWYIKQTRF